MKKLPTALQAQKDAEAHAAAAENISTAFAYVEAVFGRMDESPELAGLARDLLGLMEEPAFARLESAVKRERKRRRAGTK